jgi:hypothetical protein
MSENKDISEQLSAYLDGELPPEEARAVEQAVERDGRLAEELAALRAAREMLHCLPRRKASEDFAAAVLAKVERRRLMSAVQVTERRRLRVSLTAAIVLITVGVGTLVVYQISRVDSFQDRMIRDGASVKLPLPEERGEGIAGRVLAVEESRGSANPAAAPAVAEPLSSPDSSMTTVAMRDEDEKAAAPAMSGGGSKAHLAARQRPATKGETAKKEQLPTVTGLAMKNQADNMAQSRAASQPASAPYLANNAFQVVLNKLGLGRANLANNQRNLQQPTTSTAASPAKPSQNIASE